LGDRVHATGCRQGHCVLADYPRVNKVYDEAFAPNKPARTCVAVFALPVRERMKIDLVAYREGN
jgi:enamine deaminase RidA (YjgF/YER057c/UK114 family)